MNAIRRIGPPQAVQKMREGVYAIQLLLSEAPSADWKRLFYDGQKDMPAEFAPREVEISGSVLRFRSEAASVEQKIAWIDRWLERANERAARIAPRSQEERLRREEMVREQEELAALTARWSHL